MSLARSASGPAGLSINTAAANSLTPLAQPATGDSTAAAPSTTPAMATTGTSLFGNQQKPASGLFAQTGTGTSATAGTGLFPGTGSTTGGTGTGLFGAPSQNQQQKPGTGLFSPGTVQNFARPGGLFGTPAANTQPTTGSSLFGQSQAKPIPSLFGQPQTQQTTTGPGFGPSTNQISAVQINWDSIRPRTRFDDLAKPVQDEIALLDKGIQRVIKMKDEIGEFMPQHERDIEQLGRDVKFVESKFKTVQVALNNDIQTVKILHDMTKKSIADSQLSFKATDNLKLPTHYHQTGLFASTPPATDSTSADAAATHANAQDLITYFNRICDDIEKYKKRLDEYRSDIERDMPGVENGLYEQIRTLRERTNGNAVVQDQLGEILAALRDTGNAIIAQAGQIADTRERLSRLQAGIVNSGVYAMSMAV